MWCSVMQRSIFNYLTALLLSINFTQESQAARTGSPETGLNDNMSPVMLFLSGDVMLGRAIDQVLPYSNDPVLFEPYIRDARAYISLAEKANGPILQPVDCNYIWGDALDVLDKFKPDVRIINLETSITLSNAHWKNKHIHYRMHPKNTACLSLAKIDLISLANNHVLDWGYAGLAETLFTLEQAGIKFAGAGKNVRAASRPAIIDLNSKGRVIVSAWATADSGTPPDWATTDYKPGVNRLRSLSLQAVKHIGSIIKPVKQPGDIAVVSIHWGGNWGYEITVEQSAFAHQLIDEADIDVVHGHSSHHVKGIEIYKGKLIIYGSGDLLNDYEGIGGHDEYRADLSIMYFASVNPANGKLAQLQMVPTQIRHLKINKADKQDALWLRDMLNREGKDLGMRVELDTNGYLVLH